jgi:hypothetical protein
MHSLPGLGTVGEAGAAAAPSDAGAVPAVATAVPGLKAPSRIGCTGLR